MKTKSKVTIIYPPSLDYNFMHQRPQQIMKAFAQLGAKSIYINPANLYPDVPDVVIPFPELPNFIIVKNGVPYEHLIEGKVIIYAAVNQSDFITSVRHDLAIFDSCDLASNEFSAWKDVVPVIEANTQLVSASAPVIYDDHKDRGCETILVPNGADFDHFKGASTRLKRPDDFPKVGNRFVIGYYGAIYTWVDVELIRNIADYFPVVLIGGNTLYNLPINHHNVTQLGIKPYNELPNYLSWFDVAMIPFRLTDMIGGCDPVKCYEYLSAGKPVVATAMTELQKFKDIVYFMDRGDAVKVISKAIRENSQAMIAKRQEVMNNHSWKSRGAIVIKKIEAMLNIAMVGV